MTFNHRFYLRERMYEDYRASYHPHPAIIYSLAYPDSNEIFYIGMTSYPIAKRLSTHYVKLGFKPICEPVEVIERKFGYMVKADKAETFWIHQFLSWGFNLTNKRKNPNYKVPKRKTNASNIKIKN